MKKQPGFTRDKNVDPDIKKRSARPAALSAEKKMTAGLVKNAIGKNGSKSTSVGATTLTRVTKNKTADVGQVIRPNVIKAVKKRAAQSKGK